jgi:predicted nicotinamide N-methyase
MSDRYADPLFKSEHCPTKVSDTQITHSFCGRDLMIHESERQSFCPPYGGRVWDSAFAVASWLERHWSVYHKHAALVGGAKGPLEGLKVLELGAGAGLVGLCCAHLGAQVTLTDGAAALLPLLQHNLAANKEEVEAQGGTAEAQLLEWGNGLDMAKASARGEWDLIIGSDLAYDRDLHPFLGDTIDCLATDRTAVLLGFPTTRELFNGQIDGHRLRMGANIAEEHGRTAAEGREVAGCVPGADPNASLFSKLLLDKQFVLLGEEMDEVNEYRTGDCVRICLWGRAGGTSGLRLNNGR